MTDKEFVKQLYMDWANYYRCAGSPTSSKQANKVWQQWVKTVNPNVKKKARDWCKK